MIHRKISRRKFLKAAGTAAAVGFPCIVPSSVLGPARTVPPSEKIVMGFVGVGSMGGGHVRTFLGYDDVRVTAVCDLRQMFRQRAKDMVDQRYGDNACRSYHDYREMLASKDIDAILNATPDNWHALVGIEAARNRKDMYSEKPLSMSVAESRALRDAIKRYGAVFQFGTQQRSDERFRLACKLARNQRIGGLRTIMVGSYPSITCPNQPTQPVPDKEQFDYDMWLGPAPWAPYTYERCASRAMGTLGMWTFIHDYSLGGLSGAWGIHHVDIAQWGNGSDDTGPVEIEGTGSFPRDGLADTAISWEIEHKYANQVKMIHMDTATALKRAPQFSLHKGLGILFIGDEGWVFVCRDFIEAEPKSLLTSTFGANDIQLYRSSNHRRNFLDCVRTRRETVCPIEAAVRSDTICHIDDIAIRLGRRLRWDPDQERFLDDEQANRMLARPMRSPWHV
jgi:predicted dehydrogenase